MPTPDEPIVIRPGPVVVVGSLNMDLVVRCAALPTPGQTVAGGDLHQVGGGKGANQAAAAARLAGGGRAVVMVGRVGDDPFGRRLRADLAGFGVDVGHVVPTPAAATGTAMILVDDAGENVIVVSPGANGHLTPADLDATPLAAAAIVLLQLEVPLATVVAAVARAAGAFVVLDPAPVPAAGLAGDLAGVDLLTPNRAEAEALTGVLVRTVDDAGRAAGVLLGRGAGRVVVKLGVDGCVVCGRDAAGAVVVRHVPGFAVAAVDATAAGDTFNGALAVALAEGRTLADAARFANAAGALAAARAGAQSSIPSRAQVAARVGLG